MSIINRARVSRFPFVSELRMAQIPKQRRKKRNAFCIDDDFKPPEFPWFRDLWAEFFLNHPALKNRRGPDDVGTCERAWWNVIAKFRSLCRVTRAWFPIDLVRVRFLNAATTRDLKVIDLGLACRKRAMRRDLHTFDFLPAATTGSSYVILERIPHFDDMGFLIDELARRHLFDMAVVCCKGQAYLSSEKTSAAFAQHCDVALFARYLNVAVEEPLYNYGISDRQLLLTAGNLDVCKWVYKTAGLPYHPDAVLVEPIVSACKRGDLLKLKWFWEVAMDKRQRLWAIDGLLEHYDRAGIICIGSTYEYAMSNISKKMWWLPYPSYFVSQCVYCPPGPAVPPK